MKETLSSKIIRNCMGTPVVCTEIIKDVKEFIKDLKEKVLHKYYKSNGQIVLQHEIIEIIDKLAGPELANHSSQALLNSEKGDVKVTTASHLSPEDTRIPDGINETRSKKGCGKMFYDELGTTRWCGELCPACSKEGVKK